MNTSLTPSKKWPGVKGQLTELTVMSSGSTCSESHLAWGGNVTIWCHIYITWCDTHRGYPGTPEMLQWLFQSPWILHILSFNTGWVVCFCGYPFKLSPRLVKLLLTCQRDSELSQCHYWALVIYYKLVKSAPRSPHLGAFLICHIWSSLEDYRCTDLQWKSRVDLNVVPPPKLIHACFRSENFKVSTEQAENKATWQQ